MFYCLVAGENKKFSQQFFILYGIASALFVFLLSTYDSSHSFTVRLQFYYHLICHLCSIKCFSHVSPFQCSITPLSSFFLFNALVCIIVLHFCSQLSENSASFSAGFERNFRFVRIVDILSLFGVCVISAKQFPFASCTSMH